MLVLAIAAMVIVMSIRYYQSASTNQQLNAAVQAVTSVVAAGESYYATTSGSYSNISDDNVKAFLPGSKMPMVWGSPLQIGSPAVTSYTITISNVPPNACVPLKNLLTQNSKMGNPAGSCSSNTIGTAVVTVYQ
ncbi:MAG: hypothetical protein K0S63_302 [Gammaproteobacteria bacterium]|nr:hypothetical protein [Gammaproteobacteria bacterium]